MAQQNGIDVHGYTYVYDEVENNGSFTQINNPQCKIDFDIDYEEEERRLKIEQFH